MQATHDGLFNLDFAVRPEGNLQNQWFDTGTVGSIEETAEKPEAQLE